MAYDDSNVFARILRGELPCNRILESEHALAFHDINPLAPVHALVIPKGAYVSMDDFSARAAAAEIEDFFRMVGDVARQLGIAEGGYRLIANTGEHGHQEVPHFHMHIFGGAPLGRMLKKIEA
ncbi:MAG: histidine triad nucleotide-binding protein [Rhizobiales bacterium]|nr:histidine triad nucleotide-binding protein [Hyphomicrobiales bacterium]